MHYYLIIDYFLQKEELFAHGTSEFTKYSTLYIRE